MRLNYIGTVNSLPHMALMGGRYLQGSAPPSFRFDLVSNQIAVTYWDRVGQVLVAVPPYRIHTHRLSFPILGRERALGKTRVRKPLDPDLQAYRHLIGKNLWPPAPLPGDNRLKLENKTSVVVKVGVGSSPARGKSQPGDLGPITLSSP